MTEASDGGRRDREATKRRLVEATIEILRDEGFEQVGVNAIADRAGVSKILIYRYFGDLDGLLRAVADELDPLQSQTAERLFATIGDDASPGEIIERIVVELSAALRRDDLTKQLLIWELSRQNEVTRIMSEAREEVGVALSSRLAELLRDKGVAAGLDVHALLAIVTAGVSYLSLRADAVELYNGVNIQTSDGWRRIGSTLRLMLDRLVDAEATRRFHPEP